MEILLVEKQISEVEKELIESVLLEHDIRLNSVSSYKNAIEKLARHRYAVVILCCFNDADDLSAVEAVRIMKEIVPTLLIVAIAGDLPFEAERELRQSGLYFYMASPLEETEFKEVLAGIISGGLTRRKK